MTERASVLARPAYGFVFGLIVGGLIVLYLFAFRTDSTGQSTDNSLVVTPAAASSFVDDWTRMRLGNWATDSVFERRTNDGKAFTLPLHEARRPPDYINVTSNSITAYIDTRTVLCASDQSGKQSCRDGGAAPDARLAAAEEIAKIKKSVEGDGRAYDVALERPGCYRVFALIEVTPGQWGSGTRFCFDEATGARTLFELHREGGIDTIKATSVRSPATDKDFELPAPSGK